MSRKKLIFVTIAMCSFMITSAQHNYREYNRLGLTAGVNFFDIETDNFVTESDTGFMGAFTTRGKFYNNIDLLYGIGFMQNNVGVLVVNEQGNGTEFAKMRINSAQIRFLAGINLIKHHLSLDVGPILNVNGKLKLDNTNLEERRVVGFESTTAKDLENISPVNFRVQGGLTLGFEHFRVNGYYQYGVTNMLNRLSDENLENTEFKGNSGTLAIAATFYF